jgi:hypothetical protein
MILILEIQFKGCGGRCIPQYFLTPAMGNLFDVQTLAMSAN